MASIPLSPVESSNIKAVGHQNGTLAVQFSSGAVYHYSGVPANVYAELLVAESIGRYFAAHIRNEYTAEKQDTAA